MVPSLTAVDADGVPCAPGLLYGDERGHADRPGRDRRGGRARAVPALAGARASRRARLLDGAGGREPRAARARPSSRRPSRRPRSRCSTGSSGTRRSSPSAGRALDQMPRIGPTGQPLAEVTGRPGCVLEGGTIDAIAEQLVAGCDDVGDVLVICGTTLIVWAVIPEPVEVPNHYAIPNTAPGQVPRRRSEQRGRPVPQLGRPHVRDRWRRRRRRHGRVGRRSGPRADLGAVPARRAGAVPGLEPARRSSSISTSRTTRRRSGAPRSRPPAFVTRRMIDASPGPGAAHRRDRRRHAGRGVDRRRSPTAPGCRCTCARFPRAARSAPRSSPAWRPGSRRR